VTASTAKISGQELQECGAINESFSDIMAVSMMKNPTYGKGPEASWLVGGNGLIDGKSNMRNMANPKQSLDGMMPQPDTYKGECWNDDKYIAMGVQNKFYYLLCDGGKGTNDNNYAYDITGIGVEKGAQIAFKTLTKYCTRDIDYATARECWLKAAQELYGDNSVEAQTVAKAWDAVGVAGSDPSGINTITVNKADKWYTLSGRQLSGRPTTKGIFISNGRKVVNAR